MVIYQLDQFPNVCRLCFQPKSTDQLIPIECSSMDLGNRTLIELLNILTFEIPKDIAEQIPRSMCYKCFTEFEYIVQYQRKVTLLTEFHVAFARLKVGDKIALQQMLDHSRRDLENLFRQLNLNDTENFALDQLFEYSPEKCQVAAPIDFEPKLEDNLIPAENVSTQDDTEYYNVEYIEDGEEGSSSDKPAVERESTSTESNEPVTEFLQETVNEPEIFYYMNDNDEEEPELKVQDIKLKSEIHLKTEEHPPEESITQLPKVKQKIKMLQCLHCKYRTTSKSMFQHHVDRHENPNDENPWKCSFANCSQAYPTKDDLLRHKKELHSKYVCDICGLVVKHKYTLEIHLRRHNGDSKYPCRYCDASFITANELKLHMTGVHLNSTEFQCNECGLAFKNKKSLSLHEKTHSEQRSFTCEECKMSFKTSALLRRHHNSIHRGIKFYCDMCPISYGRKDKLRMHMEKVHKIQTYFPCEICLKTFNSALDLQEHAEHHRNPKDLECRTCLSVFLNAKDFEGHLCISYRDDYVCCSRDFKFHLQYNKHMFLAHGLKTNARVKLTSNQLLGAARASRKHLERCTKCEKVFATRKLKKDHMALCAKGELVERIDISTEQQRYELRDTSLMDTEDESNQVIVFEQT